MGRRVKITADSTCDLSSNLIEKHSIDTIPLFVNMEDQSYRDGVDIVPEDIFTYHERTGKLPNTSAVSMADYYERFKNWTDQGYSVIHLNISEAFSACFQNASAAASQLSDVHIVDTRNLSTGSGLLVLEAALLAENGHTASEVVQLIQNKTPLVEASFLIDRLHYLHQGGRCSSVAALGANLLKLRPRIDVVDGKMQVGRKFRGKYAKCLEEYVEDKLAGRTDLDLRHIFITHTRCDDPEYVQIVRSAIARCADFAEIIETEAGCTISNHCGPNTLGILFMTK